MQTDENPTPILREIVQQLQDALAQQSRHLQAVQTELSHHVNTPGRMTQVEQALEHVRNTVDDYAGRATTQVGIHHVDLEVLQQRLTAVEGRQADGRLERLEGGFDSLQGQWTSWNLIETAGFQNLDTRVSGNTTQLEVTESARRNNTQRIEQLERVVGELQGQIQLLRTQAAQTAQTTLPTPNTETNPNARNLGDLGLGTSPAPFPIAPTDRAQKRISESKNMMEGIDKVTQLHQFHAFGLSLRRICGLKYPFIHGWQDWASRRFLRPTETDVRNWAGNDWEPIAEMGRDVWTILTLKINGPGQLILDHVDKLSPLCVVKASMAWFELVRETSGRFQDRKLVLSELVIDPKMAKSWGEVPEACRKWEACVWEHEELTGAPLDDSLKLLRS